jgi:uncharacterized OB-fold protein
MAATWKLEFPYRRSVGPVIGAFLTALRDRHVVGVRTANGRVLVPPFEYDPETGDALSDMVEVGSAGVVEHAAWVTEPLRTHPLDRPFAWALVKLDGADTPMLHALDCGSADAARAGARVRIRWADETEGHIRDIACFELAEGSA